MNYAPPFSELRRQSSAISYQERAARLRSAFPLLALCCGFLLLGMGSARGQVSPAEILNPQLKANEETYLHQLLAFNHDLQSTKFPFPFYLTRYVNLDPQKQGEGDTRGLEFVKFHDRITLKITGHYAAAYNGDALTQNQRASRAFQEVIVPILRMLPKEIPADVTCDAVGFEISFHVRSRNRTFDYEGKEVLVAVFDKGDAFGYFDLPGEAARQEILNRSEIYLNGKEFGLALGERDAYNPEALDRSVPHQAPAASEPLAAPAEPNPDLRLSKIKPNLTPDFRVPDSEASGGTRPASSEASPSSVPPKPEAQGGAAEVETQADADRLQAKYQPRLDALAKDGATRFHFVEYAPPSFAVFRGRIFMQVSMRNPLKFDPGTTSIYKRAAQSFDLFLAPQLKPLIEKLPDVPEIAGVDITVLNQLASNPKPSSEALEFICPLKLLRQFVDAEITNQDLISQAVVLLNGVRIALDLQRVE